MLEGLQEGCTEDHYLVLHQLYFLPIPHPPTYSSHHLDHDYFLLFHLESHSSHLESLHLDLLCQVDLGLCLL